MNVDQPSTAAVNSKNLPPKYSDPAAGNQIASRFYEASI
jgi:hypothetical protein